ncbi:DUF4013 domain-containing protein [Methanobacterium sp.]|uniref:DUF4013 domain-containing protein n=1 Tax=Methanobacterium sp. TaxID=2164 RepID=UPI003C7585E2
MALGYIFRIIKHTINSSNELPPFGEWGDMFRDGLRYIAVTIIYLIVPNIITFVLNSGILLSIYSRGFQSGHLLIAVTGLVVALPFDLVYIMALGNMVHEDRFEAAFDFSKIFGLIGKIGWPKYVLYILIFAIIGFLLGIVSNLGTFMQISFGLGWAVGILISLLVQVYLVMYQGRYIGLIYRKGYLLAKDNDKVEGNPELNENKDIGTV